MTRLFLAACLLALNAAATFAAPTYWRVVGVAADDTLNVRAGPSASTADIGDLAPGTGGIEVAGTDSSGKWGLIVWQGGNGWLSMRYLASDPAPVIGVTAVPSGLLCSGTEPFWSVRLSSSAAAYSDIDGTDVTIGLTGSRIAEGRSDFPVQLTHRSAEAASMALIEPANCSDGMSDRIYPWKVTYLFNTASQQRFLLGCCQLPLEAGSH